MNVLWIAFVWPEPDSSAAGYRTAQFIRAIKAQGHELAVCSPCRTNDYQNALEAQGVRTVSFQPNDSAFDSYVGEFKPDVVVFDRFITEEQFGWRVRERCPDAVRMLDTIDLHSLRRIRRSIVSEGRDPMLPTDADLSSEDALREVAAIYRSDVSLIISDAEMEILQARYRVPGELLELCRMALPVADEIPDFESRRNFVVIGNFHHEPNIDSYRILQRSLWKNIRQKLKHSGIEDAELHVYGAYPTREFMTLDNPQSGFRVKGKAEDALQTLKQYRVNLAPLRFGAGIKGKIADGWAVGTPCVGTSIAAEGMHSQFIFGGIISDDWDDFATQSVALYSNESRWNEARADGVMIIKELFTEEETVSRFVRVVESSVRERDPRRCRNVVGSMLWQQQRRSTEFFSRWIEAKNLNAS